MSITGNNIVEIKKNEISEYLSLYNKDNISISKIKEDLKNIIGFIPAVNITWNKNEVLNEKTNLKETIDEPVKISVAFIDVDSNNVTTPYTIDFLI